MSPLVKVALAGGAALGLFLLTSPSNAAPSPGTQPNPVPPPVPGGGRKTRPDVFPAGSGEARVIPNSQNGIITRTEPSTRGGNSTKVAPDGDPRLAYNNDTVAVIRTGIAELGGGASEWWEVITPGGLRGFSRAIDRTGATPINNFAVVRAPSAAPAAIAGVYRGGDPRIAFRSPNEANQVGIKRRVPPRFYGRYYPRVGYEQPTACDSVAEGASPSPAAPIGTFTPGAALVCRHPFGCMLRAGPSDDADAIQILEANMPVQIQAYSPGAKVDDSSPNAGGWAQVVANVSGIPTPGFVRSEWLA